MKTFSAPRAQKFLLATVVLSIVALCVFAVRSTNHPNECKTRAHTYQSAQQQQDEETLWCPSTWAPVTTFTCLLVIATAGLWTFTAMLWLTTQRAVGDGEKASNAAQVAAEAAKASVELANKEFIASHRAKIIVRNMHFPIMPIPHIDENDIGFDVIVAFYCMNIGETEAIIDNVEASITLKHPKRPIARNQNMISCTPDRTELPFCQFGIAKVAEIIPPGYVREIREGRLFICCTGCVQYKDGRGALRQTGFVRLYNMETDRFDIVDDGEYEYSY